MNFAFNREKAQKAAEKFTQQGKFAAAIDEYKKIHDYDPLDIGIANTIGDLCAREGRPAEAAKYFLKVAELYEKSNTPLAAIAMFRKITKLEPAKAEYAVKLADLYLKQKLVGDARQQYGVAVDLFRKAN